MSEQILIAWLLANVVFLLAVIWRSPEDWPLEDRRVVAMLLLLLVVGGLLLTWSLLGGMIS